MLLYSSALLSLLLQQHRQVIDGSKNTNMAFIKFMKGAIVGSEQPKYEVISKTDDYELRSYPECQWVTLSIHDKLPDEFSRDDYRRLFDYINGKNDAGLSIDMTVPVVTHVSPVEEKEKDWSVSFFLPATLENPPNPTDSDLALSETGARELYVRTFGGMAKDADWKREFEFLKSKIENHDDVDLSEYHRAGYDPPFKPFNRRNEVWIVKKTSSVVEATTPTE